VRGPRVRLRRYCQARACLWPDLSLLQVVVGCVVLACGPLYGIISAGYSAAHLIKTGSVAHLIKTGSDRPPARSRGPPVYWHMHVRLGRGDLDEQTRMSRLG
jgi:hypothetical protein